MCWPKLFLSFHILNKFAFKFKNRAGVVLSMAPSVGF